MGPPRLRRETLNPVTGTIDIEVNEITNRGQVCRISRGSDRYRIVFDRFAAKAPFQDGGIATRVYEHGDSNNGDPLYPKTWLYLAGWGTATMYKNDQVLYKDYDAHFMVMERSRDPKTHEVRYPVKRTCLVEKPIQPEWKSISGSGRRNKTRKTFRLLKPSFICAGMKSRGGALNESVGQSPPQCGGRDTSGIRDDARLRLRPLPLRLRGTLIVSSQAPFPANSQHERFCCNLRFAAVFFVARRS